MHCPIFGHSFAVLAALILLSVLAFSFLSRRKANVRRNDEDTDIGATGSRTAPTETDNDASSSFADNYEVFLSFRGPDTRKGFTDHLYTGLSDAGIHVFRDDDELRQGENIRPELLAAITNSQISIPVLSMNYGTSSWCLDELVHIMECKNKNGQIVLPIFYNVKPADVGHQIGSFGEAFLERERRLLKRGDFNPMILKKWKKALLEVSTLKGYEADGFEAKLVKTIVRKVLNELKKKFELVITENLVGVDDHVKKIMEIMGNKSHATLFIGIYGMGGIGKTTLAKAIYNKLFNQFEHHCFIADIRESCKGGIHYVQNELIYGILKQQRNEVSNKDEGTRFISSMFKRKKVLLLLDDVDSVDQLKSLAGGHDWFSSESTIIITTRNKRILEDFGVDHSYAHKELDDHQSLILFSKHAFRKDYPRLEFEDLSRKVVDITKGLPLSLAVLGSLLCGQELPFWRTTIDKLEKKPPEEVRAKLKISYDALEYEQKQIFLDIACFFIGTDKRIVTYMWDACKFFPEEGIEVLRFMSLIKIENDHELCMHDQLRDLGREIVREENQREPGICSRLWDFKEAQKVLKGSKGTNKIEAIDLSEGRWINKFESSIGIRGEWIKGNKRYLYTGKQFKNMTSLRFLQMKGAHLSGDYMNSMEELKWLRWRGCPMNFEVTNFHVKELVILELPVSPMVMERERWRYFMMAKNLKYLNISHCYDLQQTDFLSAFKNLEVLILDSCFALERIDSSIRDMKSLRRLDLSKCYSLLELPADLGELKALEQLLLNYTRALSTLPDSITSLENLEVLDLSYSGIKELPEDIGKLRKLRELYASSCSGEKVRWMESRQTVKFMPLSQSRDPYNLQSLPELPPSLKYLNITCKSRKLPSLSHLVHLKELTVWDCQFLECIELPSALLKTSECSQLTDVEESELPQSLNPPFELEILNFTGCESIKIVDVSEFVRLKALHVDTCGNLPEVRGIDKLINLKSLTINCCNSIELLDLPESKSLTYLDVSHCLNLAEIQGIDRLEFLMHLNIRKCTSLKRLLLPESKSLKYLRVYDCIAEIQGIDRLEFLIDLTIVRCTSLKMLLLPKSQSLRRLECSGCEKLIEIQGLHGLKFLENLNISDCTLIKRVILPESRNLKRLYVDGCYKLAEIEGLDRLEFLEELCIIRCTSIERMLLPKSMSLKRVRADGCNKLAKIEGLNGLEFLERLYISECTSIERLEFLESRKLEGLFVEGCENLAEIQGLDRLKFLRILSIFGCKSLKTIPELSRTQICREKLDQDTRLHGEFRSFY